MTNHILPPGPRRLMTFFIMSAAIMNQVDTTIANVALPHIQGSVSASREQVTWVLTSYIVTLAIFTPLTGWLSSRFGRKRVVLASILVFTIASGLCGTAVGLDELIAFRILQGMAGASLVPMSQATLLDTYPPEKHGDAMAIFGMAAIAGPLIGPLAGGWLTEHLSWRWCFFINLPIGAIAALGLIRTMPDFPGDADNRLDFVGFGLLATGIAALQLVIDRGQTLDWFGSTEICIEALLAVVALYLFVVHSTLSRRPFVNPVVFTDRNFVVSTIVGFFLGMIVYSPMSLLPEMLSGLFDYPIMDVGLVMAPRGIGVLITMVMMKFLINKVDPRYFVALGMATAALAMWAMSGMDLEASATLVILTGVIHGTGSSATFAPLSMMTFSTLPSRLRNEGAAINSLVRSYGGAFGIAIVQVMLYRNEATVQSRLTEGVRPDNPALQAAMPGVDFGSARAIATLESEVARQALMVSYVDAFWALAVISLFASGLVFMLRRPRNLDDSIEHTVVE